MQGNKFSAIQLRAMEAAGLDVPTLSEKKKGLWDNIHAKRKRGEKPAKPGDKDYPKTLNVEGIDPKGAARMDAAKGKKAETQDQKEKRLMLGKYSPAVKYAKMKKEEVEEVQLTERERVLESLRSRTKDAVEHQRKGTHGDDHELDNLQKDADKSRERMNSRMGADAAGKRSEFDVKRRFPKKERDYAKWQRDKGQEDAQKSGHRWKHAKGSTREKEGKKSVKDKYIKDSYESGEKKNLAEKSAAWQRKEGKNKTGGLNEKGRKSYERENPGSDLKAPQPEGGPRKRSFCARMGGVKGPMKKPNGEPTRKALALRKWKC